MRRSVCFEHELQHRPRRGKTEHNKTEHTGTETLDVCSLAFVWEKKSVAEKFGGCRWRRESYGRWKAPRRRSDVINSNFYFQVSRNSEVGCCLDVALRTLCTASGKRGD